MSIDQLGHSDASMVVPGAAALGVVALLVWGGTLPKGRGGAAAHHRGRGRLPIRDIWLILLVSALVQLCTGLSATTIGSVTAAFAVSSFLVRAIMPNLLRRLGEGAAAVQ